MLCIIRLVCNVTLSTPCTHNKPIIIYAVFTLSLCSIYAVSAQHLRVSSLRMVCRIYVSFAQHFYIIYVLFTLYLRENIYAQYAAFTQYLATFYASVTQYLRETLYAWYTRFTHCL
jgi:hypothetical protein